jgi:hypothetical protein
MTLTMLALFVLAAVLSAVLVQRDLRRTVALQRFRAFAASATKAGVALMSFAEAMRAVGVSAEKAAANMRKSLRVAEQRRP